MEKDNFIELLKRNDPEEILDFLKKHSKKPKSVCPLIFYDKKPNKDGESTN